MGGRAPGERHIPPFEEDRCERDEAARILGVAPASLELKAFRDRHSIPYYKVGHLVQFRRSDLRIWLESRRAIPVET